MQQRRTFAFAAGRPVLSPVTETFGLLDDIPIYNLLTFLVVFVLRLFPLSAPSVGHGFRMHRGLGHNLDAVSGLNSGCIRTHTPFQLSSCEFLKSFAHFLQKPVFNLRRRTRSVCKPRISKGRCWTSTGASANATTNLWRQHVCGLLAFHGAKPFKL